MYSAKVQFLQVLVLKAFSWYQCSLPRTYILSGKRYQSCNSVKGTHFLVFFIGILPSQTRNISKWTFVGVLGYDKYCPQIFSFKIVNVGLFET